MNEADKQRFFELVEDTSIDNPIAVYRAEQQSKLALKQRMAQEAALDNTYRVARVEAVEAFDQVNGTSRGYVDSVTDIIRVSNRLLPEFAKQYGLDLNELRAALESRRKEAKNKVGERFQLYPLAYDPRIHSSDDENEARAEREIMEKNEKHFQAVTRQRQANLAKVKPKTVLERVFSGK